MPAELAEDEIDTERLSRISRPDSTEVEPASSWLEAGATNNGTLKSMLNRVRSEMRRFYFAFGFGDVLDPGETRFRI
ncbi:MAG: hypothetical protein AADX96_10965, partial [Thiocapsa sp. C3-sup]